MKHIFFSTLFSRGKLNTTPPKIAGIANPRSLETAVPGEKQKLTSLLIIKYTAIVLLVIAIAIPYFLEDTSRNTDTMAPVIANHKSNIDKTEVTIFFKSDASGIAFTKVYALTDRSEQLVKPLRYSSADNSVTFAFPKETIHLFIPDKKENVLHLTLSPK